MSLGKMNRTIDLISSEPVKDAEGFAVKGDHVVASVRAYKEERRGDVKWANMAAFSTATVLYRFRTVPGLEITTALTISDAGERLGIVSVDHTKGRGMYVELYAESREGTVR